MAYFDQIGLGFLGALGDSRPNMKDSLFQNWLRQSIYKFIDSEHCTRFLFRNIDKFEIDCIKLILGDICLDEKISKKIGAFESGVEFLFIVTGEGRLARSIDIAERKKLIEDMMTYPLKFPISLSPYVCPGGEQDQIFELFEISDYMLCCLPPDGTEDEKRYYGYGKNLGIGIANWYDQ